MVKLYGLKTCDTCRKALKALENNGKSVDFRDIRENPLTAEELSKFYAELGQPLLNTRSTTWRGLDEAERGKDPLELLAAHPALMKRPVIETDRLYLGWTADVQGAVLAG